MSTHGPASIVDLTVSSISLNSVPEGYPMAAENMVRKR